ncbi:MAG: agmatinase [Novibacillus thermophilus]
MTELNRKWQSTGVFNYTQSDYDQAKVVIVGAPMDYSVSFKTGTRFGPQGIRHASYGLEEYSPYVDRHFSNVPVCDKGDLVLPFGNVEESLNIIYKGVKEVVQDKKVPFVLGGEHLISLPCIQAVAEHYPDLVVLHFDAHTDLRDSFFGEKLSHATVIRRVIELLGKGKVYHYGIRSGEQHEFRYADAMSHMRRYTVLTPLKDDIKHLQNRPVYVTFDIDCIDPAYCPGTGTPEPGGISSAEAFEAIHLLKELNVVGMDLVEVSPHLDHSGITDMTAAKLVREAILSYWF